MLAALQRENVSTVNPCWQHFGGEMYCIVDCVNSILAGTYIAL